MNMVEAAEYRLPVLSVASILLPAVAAGAGACVVYLADRLPEFGFAVFAVGSVLGALCVVLSWLRRERPLFVLIAGLVLNVPGCWLFLFGLALGTSEGGWT